MLKCGDCGGGFILVGKTYYGCANTHNKGTCSNRRTIRRDVLEARVLDGLKEQLLHPDLIAEFVRAYQAEFNRLAAENRKSRAKAERELAQVRRKIDQIIDAITEGMFPPSMKNRMTALENRKAALKTEIESADAENPVLLHPGLADMYRKKVAGLAEALNDPGTSARAAEVIRSLLPRPG